MDANRQEYLMLRYIEGSMAEDEARELSELVSNDPEARRELLRQVQIAGALVNAHRQPSDAAAADLVMAAIAEQEKHTEMAANSVMDRLGSMDRDATSQRVIWPSVLRWVALGAAASVIAMLALWPGRDSDSIPSPKMPAGASGLNAGVAEIVEVKAGATVLNDGVASAALPGMRLMSGTQIETEMATGGVIRLPSDTSPVLKLRYVAHKTELLIESGTTVRFDGDRVVALDQGMISARVEKQAPGKQFEVHSKHASMRALGTAFSVSGDEHLSSL
ncbi:MAG: hypothetical protein C0404_08395, partial [Verrucomicrobia bacterium]|nr:hypothetical protein [Verrucomicrobiota bacterium]